MARTNFNVGIKSSVEWHTHFTVGGRGIEGKSEHILVDVLPSGKSIFSVFTCLHLTSCISHPSI